MPAHQISCPNCDLVMKVPDTVVGKKIRCKECEHVFVVTAPGAAAAKPLSADFKKPGPAKKAKPKAEEPAPVDAPIKFADEEPKKKPADDDDDDEANPYGVIKEGEVARCPHCAYELDPPDTKVCLNCGYDMVQRRRHESKKVFAHTKGDFFKHWLPAIIWLLVMITMIVVTVICFINMRKWMTGSFLDKEEKNAVTGETEFYIGPGCFIMLVTLITMVLCILGGKFSYKRLVLGWRPTEVEKKK